MAKYVDINLDIDAKHPITGDIGRLTDAQAINVSIRNLLFTRKGTIPWNRFKGTDLWKLIGETNTTLIRHIARDDIRNCLSRWEPRINLIDVTVDAGETENHLKIAIIYSIKGTGTRHDFEMDLSLNR